MNGAKGRPPALSALEAQPTSFAASSHSSAPDNRGHGQRCHAAPSDLVPSAPHRGRLGLVALLVAAATAVLVGGWASAALGGRTGDTLDATVALAEAAVAVALLSVA